MSIKVKVLMTVVVNKAKIEFKEGMGVGVLSSQEVTFTLPKKYSHALLAGQIHEAGQRMRDEVVRVDVKVIE
jgi:hypothetical protein